MDRRDGGDAQGVALAAPYGHALVERGALGGSQVGGAEEVGDLAGHAEGDRRFRGRGVRVGGCVLGQEVGDGGTDGAAADAVVAGEGGDGPAFQVHGAYGVGLVGRDGRAAPALAAFGLGGPQPVVGQLALEVAPEFAGGGEGLHHGNDTVADAIRAYEATMLPRADEAAKMLEGGAERLMGTRFPEPPSDDDSH